MPTFEGRVCAAYLDVDLAASTRTCLKYLYPKLSPGGVLMSQDGDFPLVLEVFNDEQFWEHEIGAPMPRVEGLGRKKMLKIVKDAGGQR
jgi:O-methyltransferase